MHGLLVLVLFNAPASPLIATVQIDAAPGSKRFQGVWLKTKDGRRLLIDYRAHPWWRPFEGREVEVTGQSYTPRGQAIQAEHYRVKSMKVRKPTVEDSLISISGEVELTGTFTVYTWPKGTKLEGEKNTIFRTTSGETYWLSQRPEPMPKLDQAVKIKARVVEPSPFVARPGGPYLWVVSASPKG